MEPIPETRELLDVLWVGSNDERLEDWLLTRAQQVAALIPDCAGATIALIGDLGLTFTFVATADHLRLVDSAQYLHDGPCEQTVRGEDTSGESDLLDEKEWRLAALAGAATGVTSTLSLPIRARGDIVGSVNFYGVEPGTFSGRAGALAKLFGAATEEAVSNADLSMTGVDRARQATTQMVDETILNTATGILAERERLPLPDARRQIEDAARRAGVDVAKLANLIVRDAEEGARRDG